MADDLFSQQLDGAEAELSQELQGQADASAPQSTLGSIAQGVNDAVVSASVGMHKAVFETKDTLFGEPAYAQKSQYRKDVEALGANLERKSIVNGLARGVAQFGTEFIGLGKVVRAGSWALKGVGAARAGAAVASAAKAEGVAGMVRGAVAGAVGFDPHEERLSNLIESFPSLNNPVTGFLAAKPEDSAAVGRLKNALEGLGLDVTLAAGMTLAMKSIKLFRSGDVAGAKAAADQADLKFAKAPETGEPPPPQPYTPVDYNGPLQDANVTGFTSADIPATDRGVKGPLWQAGVLSDGTSFRGYGDMPKPANVNVDVGAPNVADAAYQGIVAKVREAGKADEKTLLDITGGTRQYARDLLKKMEEDGIVARDKRGRRVITNKGADSGIQQNGPAAGQPDLGTPGGSPSAGGDAQGLGGAPQAGQQGAPDAGLSGGTLGPQGGGGSLQPPLSEGAPRGPQAVGGDGQDVRGPSGGPAQGTGGSQQGPDRLGGPGGTVVDGIGGPAGGRGGDGAGQGSVAVAPPGSTPKSAPPPTILDVPPIEVERTVARLRSDDAAITKYGSRESAEAAGVRFGNAEYIPYQKLGAGDNVGVFAAQLTERVKSAMLSNKGGNAEGVMKDKWLVSRANRMADAFGEDPASLLGYLQRMAEQDKTAPVRVEASLLLANKAFEDSYQLARRITEGNFGGYVDREAAMADVKRRMELAVTLFGTARSAIGASGRTLRRLRGSFQFGEEQLRALQSVDPEALLNAVAATGGRPEALRKLSSPTLLARLADGAQTVMVNGFLSSPDSQLINFMTSSAMLGWRPTESLVGGAVQGMVGAIKGDAGLKAAAYNTRLQARREMLQTGAQLIDGFMSAWQAFVKGDSVMDPHNLEALTGVAGSGAMRQQRDLSSLWRPVEGLDDVLHNAYAAAHVGIGMPSRLLGAADELVKTTRYRAVVAAKASIEADQAGLKAGSKEYKEYIKRAINGAFDEAGLAVDDVALQEARISTFQQELLGANTQDTHLGWMSAGRAWQAFGSNFPVARVITPFVKTPTNLFRYGVKLTPGLNLLQKEYTNALRGLKGPEEQARAIGQMMMGSMLASIGVYLRMNGSLTGAGPSDPRQARAWRENGNRPYAITWTNADGQKQSMPINRYDPIQAPLALVADVTDMMVSGQLTGSDVETLATATVMALSNQFKNKTYLMNIGQFIGAVTDPDRTESWVRNFTSGFLPYSALLRYANPDPYMREVRSVADAFMAKVPGLSPDLPPRRDIFGDPVAPPASYVQNRELAGPLAVALDDMYATTGTYFSNPAPRTPKGDIDMREFTLESGRSAYDRYQELAGHPPGRPSLKAALEKAVKSKEYRALPHGKITEQTTKEAMLGDIVSAYRRSAMQQLMKESASFREAVYSKQLQNVRAAKAGMKSPEVAGHQQGVEALNSLLSPYGLGVPNLPAAPPAGPAQQE